MAGQLAVRRRRRAPSKFRLRKPHWIDPFPFIPGTEPEKRIFEVLVRRRLYFVFQDFLPDYADSKAMRSFLNTPNFQPDIRLPEYRVIIDPFGIYHHSLPDQVKRDAVKSVVYRKLGYTFVHPWWDDRGFLLVEDGGHFRRVGFDAIAVLDSIPELHYGPRFKLTDPRDIAAKKTVGYRLGAALGTGSRSVAAANTARANRRRKGLRLRPSGRRRPVRHRL